MCLRAYKAAEQLVSDHKEVFQADGFEVCVIRTPRKKTFAMKVINGQVEVRVPRATPTSGVAQLVSRKTHWIREKLLQQQRQIPLVQKTYVTGDIFRYLGGEVVLRVCSGATKGVSLTDGKLLVRVPTRVKKREQFVLAELQTWFRHQAEIALPIRVDHYAKMVGAEPVMIKVRRYKARWGSCNSRGEVTFNWLIMVAPTVVVNYVVVHELCHLLHLNHSPNFWETVERTMPDYRQHRRWLRLNGWRLVV